MDISDIQSNATVLNVLIAFAIFILGIFIGKASSYILRKFSDKLELDKKVRPSFIGLIINLIRWSIYLLFLNMALSELPLPALSKLITNALLTIPFFVASIIILVFGFAVAEYLKDVLQEAATPGWKFLSIYLFYFVIFISGVYSLKLALFSIDSWIANNVIIVMSVAFSIGLTYKVIKKEIN